MDSRDEILATAFSKLSDSERRAIFESIEEHIAADCPPATSKVRVQKCPVGDERDLWWAWRPVRAYLTKREAAPEWFKNPPRYRRWRWAWREYVVCRAVGNAESTWCIYWLPDVGEIK